MRTSPDWRSVQISYFLSLALLSLMKPNMAGVTIVGGVVLLFLVTDRKMRLVLLTLAATAAAVGVLLLNHVSIPAMLANYHSVAKVHGGLLSRTGSRVLSMFDKVCALIGLIVLSVPLLVPGAKDKKTYL